MSEIMKVYKQSVPAMRFIGKKYSDYDHWGEWFCNGWFDVVENAMGGVDAILNIWEDGSGYVGMELRKDGELLEYWIGMFTPENTEVPEGFDCLDFAEGNFGTCWIYGKEEDVHGTIGECWDKIKENEMELDTSIKGAVISFENGLCPRFTMPDEKGNVILDYCFKVK